MGIYEKVNTKTIMKKCEQLWRLIMKNYKCTVCGYTYKPERGDKLNDIPPNTSFDDLPENWKCPTCNQPKMAFEEIK